MDTLSARIDAYLRELTSHPDRHVGGPGNRAATQMFAERIAPVGFDVARTQFDCIEWEYGDTALEAGGERYEAHAGPYSLSCDLRSPLTSASTVEELESGTIRDTIALLRGDIARGQLMPKNFTFYNPEGHRRIIRALEEHAPAAVLAATGKDPQLVGGQYPFPLFEDGDFDIPSAYMKDVDGERLLSHVGTEVVLRIDSRRVPTTAEHVVATREGNAPGRIVVFAHIDSRKGSPGALDNASGVAVLLGLAELLADYVDGPSLEIVPLNGEDNYANPGEMLWVAENEERFEEIVLGINVDDAGWRGHDTHVSFYECPDEIERIVRDAMESQSGFDEGPQWFQSDHAIFGIYGRPAIAVTSSDGADFMAEYAHTERDTRDLADPEILAGIARFLREVVEGVAFPRGLVGNHG